MGRYDYDDMPAKNNSRGGKGNRRTALATVFFILVALIVLVIYLIVNPQESVDVTAKERKTTAVSADTPTKETEDSEKPRLITLAPEAGNTSAVTEETEITGNTETPASGETELPAEEETIAPERGESVIEEAVSLRDNIADEPVIDEEIVPGEETTFTEEKPVEDEAPVIEEEVIVEEITSEEKIPLTEKETETEDETPVIEEEIVVEEIIPEEEIIPTDEETAEDEVPVIEEEIVIEEITPAEETIPTDEKLAEDEAPVNEEEIIVEEITPVEETTSAEEVTVKEDKTPAIEEGHQKKEPLLEPTAEEIEKTQEEVPASVAEDSILRAVEPASVVSGGEAHFEDGVLVIKGKNGSAVKAVRAGTVTKTGRDNGLKYIVVTDDDGAGIRYTGFERVLVKLESRVKSSAVLGSIGSTTSSTIRLSVENDV